MRQKFVLGAALLAAAMLPAGAQAQAIISNGTVQMGVRAFGDRSPDAVVLDYRLPDMDGLEVIAAIRKQDPDVPIVMITGHGSIELAVDAMKAGANDLVTKPVNFITLASTLTQCILKRSMSRNGPGRG